MPRGAASPHVESAALSAYNVVFLGLELYRICVLVAVCASKFGSARAFVLDDFVSSPNDFP